MVARMRRLTLLATTAREFLQALKQSTARADSGFAPTSDLAVGERVLDVVVEEFTLRFSIEQPVVDFQWNAQVAIGLAARERDVELAGIIVVFDERHHR